MPMFPTNKQHRNFCVEHITIEEKLSCELQDHLDRLTMYQLINTIRGSGSEINLINSDGTKWSKEGHDYVNSMCDKDPKDFHKELENLLRDKKLSTYKQKFWRYAHNLDHDKAKKYADKSHELQKEILDEVLFDDKDSDIIVVMTPTEGESEFSKNSKAVMVLGEELKAWKNLTDTFFRNFHHIPRK